MKKVLTICAIVTMVLAVSSSVQAGITVNWNTGGVALIDLGSDGSFTGKF